MAIFGIEKTKDFTIMSNYHLRNIKLSLKAKGFFSLMLPFPEGWDYTIMEFYLSLQGRQRIGAVRVTILQSLSLRWVTSSLRGRMPHTDLI